MTIPIPTAQQAPPEAAAPRPTTPFRRVVLAATILLGLFVGGWAVVAPEAFYDAFPGFGLHWIDLDGPYNEHLIRDVGALYLGLGSASVVGLAARTALPGTAAGVAWSVFGVLHFGYHALHPEGTALDQALALVSLGVSLLLGVLLLLPARRTAAAR